MGKFLAQTHIADTFNDYFSSVVQSLNIPRENSMLNTDLCINPVLEIAEKYKHHHSFISINKKVREKVYLSVSISKPDILSVWIQERI